MKLLFKKNDDLEISVYLEENGDIADFNYIEMIKKLILEKKLDEPGIEGEFTEAEKLSIRNMCELINKEVEAQKTD